MNCTWRAHMWESRPRTFQDHVVPRCQVMLRWISEFSISGLDWSLFSWSADPRISSALGFFCPGTMRRWFSPWALKWLLEAPSSLSADRERCWEAQDSWCSLLLSRRPLGRSPYTTGYSGNEGLAVSAASCWALLWSGTALPPFCQPAASALLQSLLLPQLAVHVPLPQSIQDGERPLKGKFQWNRNENQP